MSNQKFPKKWSKTAIAVFYMLMCDLTEQDAEVLWQNTSTRRTWMLGTSGYGQALNLSADQYRRARRTILDQPTVYVPPTANKQMVVLYWVTAGLVKGGRMFEGSMIITPPNSMWRKKLEEVGCVWGPNIQKWYFDPYDRAEPRGASVRRLS